MKKQTVLAFLALPCLLFAPVLKGSYWSQTGDGIYQGNYSSSGSATLVKKGETYASGSTSTGTFGDIYEVSIGTRSANVDGGIFFNYRASGGNLLTVSAQSYLIAQASMGSTFPGDFYGVKLADQAGEGDPAISTISMGSSSAISVSSYVSSNVYGVFFSTPLMLTISSGTVSAAAYASGANSYGIRGTSGNLTLTSGNYVYSRVQAQSHYGNAYGIYTDGAVLGSLTAGVNATGSYANASAYGIVASSLETVSTKILLGAGAGGTATGITANSVGTFSGWVSCDIGTNATAIGIDTAHLGKTSLSMTVYTSGIASQIYGIRLHDDLGGTVSAGDVTLTMSVGRTGILFNGFYAENAAPAKLTATISANDPESTGQQIYGIHLDNTDGVFRTVSAMNASIAFSNVASSFSGGIIAEKTSIDKLVVSKLQLRGDSITGVSAHNIGEMTLSFTANLGLGSTISLLSLSGSLGNLTTNAIHIEQYSSASGSLIEAQSMGNLLFKGYLQISMSAPEGETYYFIRSHGAVGSINFEDEVNFNGRNATLISASSVGVVTVASGIYLYNGMFAETTDASSAMSVYLKDGASIYAGETAIRAAGDLKITLNQEGYICGAVSAAHMTLSGNTLHLTTYGKEFTADSLHLSNAELVLSYQTIASVGTLALSTANGGTLHMKGGDSSAAIGRMELQTEAIAGDSPLLKFSYGGFLTGLSAITADEIVLAAGQYGDILALDFTDAELADGAHVRYKLVELTDTAGDYDAAWQAFCLALVSDASLAQVTTQNAGDTYAFVYEDDILSVDYTTIPEPAAAWLAGLAALACLLRRRAR